MMTGFYNLKKKKEKKNIFINIHLSHKYDKSKCFI